MIRNTTLPQRVRAQAQLQLAQMHAYTRSTQIKNRCVETGKAKAVFRDFRLTKVCYSTVLFYYGELVLIWFVIDPIPIAGPCG